MNQYLFIPLHIKQFMSIKFCLEYFLHNIPHNSNMNCKKRIILISLSHCDHQIGIYIEKTKKDKPCFAEKV